MYVSSINILHIFRFMVNWLNATSKSRYISVSSLIRKEVEILAEKYANLNI